MATSPTPAALRHLRFLRAGRCIAQGFRPATDAERQAASRILVGLKKLGRKATGRLHSELFADYSLDRDSFEELLGAMARVGWIELSEASFEQDGRRVAYRLASLSSAGLDLDPEALPPFEMKLEIEAVARRRKKSPRREKKRKKEKAAAPPKAKPLSAPPASAPPPAAPAVESALRAWRLAEAAHRGVPAFRIMSDKSLQAIAARKPSSIRELLEIPGIGARVAEQYGARIFRILERD